MIRKAMSAALTLVITIVVLIVVALALITITTENVAQTGGSAANQQNEASCNIWKSTACTGQAVDTTVTHPSITDCECTCDGISIKCPSRV